MEELEAVRVGQAAYGKGVYARRRFKKGAAVGEVTGEVIDTEGYDSNYCIDLGGPRRLEPEAPFRFINPSCTPNCRFTWYEPLSKSDPLPNTVWVEALRVIEPGEELSIDYCWPSDAAIRCGCRSPRCRGWIVDPAELPALAGR
ncbi:MAG: nuclear protein [Planctomycetaceae bacterium]|nr:nuclear protein [Planctomycetaceae bacterium]